MSAATTLTDTDEQISTTLTIRVPRGFGDGDLAESARTRLKNVSSITHATMHSIENIAPQGGVTLVTVTATLSMDTPDAPTSRVDTLTDTLTSSVSVHAVESLEVNTPQAP